MPVRRYDAGPLTAEDFQAAVPRPLPRLGRQIQLGFADSDIRFTFKYRYQETPDGVDAQLREVDVFGVFMREKSWLAQQNPKAIDHEQGHFDITQVYALQANLELNQRLADGKTLVGHGEDVRAAVADLEQKLRDLLKPVYERAAVAQQEYDRQTRHGAVATSQAQHRKRQLEVLKELNEDLAALAEPAE